MKSYYVKGNVSDRKWNQLLPFNLLIAEAVNYYGGPSKLAVRYEVSEALISYWSAGTIVPGTLVEDYVRRTINELECY